VDLATWCKTALTGDVGDTDEFNLLVELGAGAGLQGAWLLPFSLYSYRIQIDPFSPIRYDTSRGSIHMVSSDGKVECIVLAGIPTISAACAMMGSMRPLIRMQR